VTKKIKVADVVQLEQLFEQLSASESSVCPFKEWELLFELDKQERQSTYRRERDRETKQVRAYLRDHPEVEKKLMGRVNARIDKS
jgi:hypothetical protein